MRLDSLRRCKPDQVRGYAGDRTLSALDPHVDAEALPCRCASLPSRVAPNRALNRGRSNPPEALHEIT